MANTSTTGITGPAATATSPSTSAVRSSPASRQLVSPSARRTSDRASRFADVDTDAPQPFVVDDFIKSLITAFMPKDLAARAGKQIYCIRQGPAQPLALFMGDYNSLCTRAGRYGPINKAALNKFTRSAAAIRGFRSDLDFDEYSRGLIELATELEQLPAFRTAKGSKVSVHVDRQTGVPLPTMAEASRPAAPAPCLDRDGDTVMSGVHAMATASHLAAQISALESRLGSSIAASRAMRPAAAPTRGRPPATSRRWTLRALRCEPVPPMVRVPVPELSGPGVRQRRDVAGGRPWISRAGGGGYRRPYGCGGRTHCPGGRRCWMRAATPTQRSGRRGPKP
ncbi:hypothetical protein E4U58_001134 [Claviceps cyperi]|nr:hypothetical protein E4U58_001134 [Claviceps cyperi]